MGPTLRARLTWVFSRRKQSVWPVVCMNCHVRWVVFPSGATHAEARRLRILDHLHLF